MMQKLWYPQRSEIDSSIALLKNFIYYLKYPISKYTIEKDVMESPDFPFAISLATFMKLLEKWNIHQTSFKCPTERLKDIAFPSLLFLKATEKNEGNFVMVLSANDNEIEYLDTRKGWIIENIADFAPKFANIALSVQSISHIEPDFETKEQQYEEKRLTNPELLNNVSFVDNFLTDAECEYVINLATPLFKRTMFMYGNEKVIKEGITSHSAELNIFPDDVILNKIRKRASELIKLPESHFEGFQCLSYDEQQEIDYHYDTFNENYEGGKKIITEGGQRKYTLLAYLNDDFVGGSTYFPKLDYLVNPKKGSVLIFNNLDEMGDVLKCSWHGGLPVITGRKFAMNIWARNKPLI